ncbi:MAG: FAD-dependent oxidoreductase [Candidatus Zixiibacteriota bacterium]
MQQSDFVIVGGVAAGPKTAATLMRRLPGATVTLFQRDEHLSYASCGLPFFASGDVGRFEELTLTSYGVPRDAAFFKHARGFEAVTGAEVIDIARDRKVVTVRRIASGECFEHGYGKLVLATGAVPARPPFPVANSPRIRPFHVPEDAIMFRRMAEHGEIGSAVIVGGGFIGCELAEAVGSLWGITVTLIEREPQLLPGMLDDEMAALVRQELSRHDVMVIPCARVEKVDLDPAGKPTVMLGAAPAITSDFVFVALGLRPEVSLARQCGLRLGASGAIVVDAGMRTSDPDIYAGGDCVESTHQITGEALNLCLGSLANRHGRVIAENLAGGDVQFPGVLGARLLKVYDLNVGAVGLTETEAHRAGFDAAAVWGGFADKPDYLPEVGTMVLKLVYDRGSERLLGLQAVGTGDICRRIDVFSSFLQQKARLGALLAFEHGYAPPFAEALDPLHHLAAIARAQQRGTRFLSPSFDFHDCTPGQTLVLDVRQDEEVADRPLPDVMVESSTKTVHISLDQLARRLHEIERGARVIVVCQRGVRSYQASLMLKAASFENVEVIGGGLQAVVS